MCWPDLAKPAVIRRKIFQAQDLRSEDQTVFKSRAAQDTLVLLCEGFGLMTLVELHLDPAKYSVKDGPSRPLVRDELFGPHLLAVGDWSDCRHPIPAGAPLYFEPMERGWQAPTWRLTEESDPLFVVASYAVAPENLAIMQDLQIQFHQRVREKEKRGSLHYQWNWRFADGQIYLTATELYVDLQGFEEHMEACEDLFPLAEKARTILGVDMHGSSQTMSKCEIYTHMFPVRRFSTCFWQHGQRVSFEGQSKAGREVRSEAWEGILEQLPAPLSAQEGLHLARL